MTHEQLTEQIQKEWDRKARYSLENGAPDYQLQNMLIEFLFSKLAEVELRLRELDERLAEHKFYHK